MAATPKTGGPGIVDSFIQMIGIQAPWEFCGGAASGVREKLNMMVATFGNF